MLTFGVEQGGRAMREDPINTEFYNLIKDKHPGLLTTIEELLRRGQTPDQIAAYVEEQLTGDSSLPGLVEGAARYLKEKIETTRTLTLDLDFPFRGPLGRGARCHLQVYEEPKAPAIVIATELDDNPGMSITNAAETLADQVCRFLEKPEYGIIWVEHVRHESRFDDCLAESTLTRPAVPSAVPYEVRQQGNALSNSPRTMDPPPKGGHSSREGMCIC